MSKQNALYDAVVLGAGAAGLMCALTAGGRGRRILVLERNETPGKKIRISGGGRCNFTNLHTGPDSFISANPNFCRSALARYTPADFIAFVERHGIAYHEKKLGQLFCDGSAQQIIDALLEDCAAARVDCVWNCSVNAIAQRGDDFELETSSGTYEAKALVVATGGLSIPKIGATDLGYQIARQFSVPIIPCAPALVPLIWNSDDAARFGELAGLSFDSIARVGSRFFREDALFTHRGMSGPAVLQISSYWSPGLEVAFDLVPGALDERNWLAAKRDAPNRKPESLLAERLPGRLARRWTQVYNWTQPLQCYSDKALRTLAAQLHDWRITPAGTEGYAKAEVTRGGVDTRALSPKTMCVRDIPGLYFIGEVVDVTGWLGGYNFQWAWASGVAAGQAL